jgi:hypothetical protein
MKYQLALLIFSIILIRGCCSAPNRLEPPIPNESLGWSYREERGIRVQGDFLLHRGEATSNDKIQVRVLDLLSGDPCAEKASYLSSPAQNSNSFNCRIIRSCVKIVFMKVSCPL